MSIHLLQQPPESWRESIEKLMGAWNAGRFPQAVLLDGPAGIGKKRLAMELAAFLTCEDEAHRPCTKCFSCKTAFDPGAADRWILPLAIEAKDRDNEDKVAEAQSELLRQLVENPYSLRVIPATAFISVHQVRHLWQRISFKATGTRAFIIAEADCLNDNAANALLKTLEEVPPNTYFILTTAHRNNLLQTIQSRTMPLRLPPLSPDEVAQVLAVKGFDVPSPDLLGMSMGSVGKAMQSLEMNLPEAQQRAVEFLQFVAAKKWSRLFRSMDAWFAKELEAALFFLEVLAMLVEDLLRRDSGAPVRFPSCLDQGLKAFRSDTTARILVAISQTVRRLEDRKGTVSVALQALALQFGE